MHSFVMSHINVEKNDNNYDLLRRDIGRWVYCKLTKFLMNRGTQMEFSVSERSTHMINDL